jgi:hypothetical protein
MIVGGHNQIDAYLVVVKKNGNENGTPVFDYKNQERRVSFEIPDNPGK